MSNKDLAEALNLLGGKPVPEKYEYILEMYDKGIITYEEAIKMIKVGS